MTLLTPPSTLNPEPAKPTPPRFNPHEDPAAYGADLLVAEQIGGSFDRAYAAGHEDRVRRFVGIVQALVFGCGLSPFVGGEVAVAMATTLACEVRKWHGGDTEAAHTLAREVSAIVRNENEGQ